MVLRCHILPLPPPLRGRGGAGNGQFQFKKYEVMNYFQLDLKPPSTYLYQWVSLSLISQCQ